MARLRPYLIRATYDWLVDHEFTPHFLIATEFEDVMVPWEYVEDGSIILNASPVAVHNLQLEDQFISFEASFAGQVQEVYAPMAAVLALYSSETGQGIYAREETYGMLVNEGEDEDEIDPEGGPFDDGSGKGGLHIVK